MKSHVLFGVAVSGMLAASANAGLLFYATNNLSNANFGTGGDELIIFDFNTALWSSVGVITTPDGRPVPGGLGGLDWARGVGNGPLIASTSFGAGSAMYAINPADATAVNIGSAPVPMSDLAYNTRNGRMYGTDAADRLWRDDNGDSIPETLVGSYGIGALEVGLGFDGAGNVYVHDLITDIIYRGVGDDPASLVPLVFLPFDSNFSQGLYVGGDLGYHGAFNNSAFSAENYSFNLDGSNYQLQSTFATWEETMLPEVEVGDLTPFAVPGPASLALLALGGLVRRRRRH